MSSLLIKNGLVVTESEVTQCDIYCVGEKINAIETHITEHADKVVDATGMIVLPGGIDVHTHLDLPVQETSSCDDFESGTRAALFGGTTTIIDFATQPKDESVLTGFRLWSAKARDKALCDYGFHMAITDFAKTNREDLLKLISEEGITSFKAYMAYESIMLTDEELAALFNMLRGTGGLLMLHAEDGNTILGLSRKFVAESKKAPRFHALSHPPEAELLAIRRALDLAQKQQSPLYIVHLSTAAGLDLIREAAARGVAVNAEACVPHLVLDEAVYRSDSPDIAQYVLSPPLRSESDQVALWQGLTQGAIKVLATDHCPFTLAQKSLGHSDFTQIPNGVSSIEHRMALAYHYGVHCGRISLIDLAHLTAANPAKIFGLYPRKGVLKKGSDADILLLNPQQQQTITIKKSHSKCDYNLFEGWTLQGAVNSVFLRGRQVIKQRELLAEPGSGRYIRRGPSTVLS
jgi:dihydropyrimidinase